MSQPTPAFAIEDLKITFSEDPNPNTIIIALPCGCETKLMARVDGGANQFGNPMQFASYCKHHFYGW